MTRRTFLKTAAALAFPLANPPSNTDANSSLESGEAVLTIDPSRRGAVIPNDFLGLSYESAEIGDAAFFTPDNHGLLALVRRLGPNGVLRIGGNSSASTRWQSAGGAPRHEKQTIITTDTIGRMADFVRASDWKLIYGLNLGQGTPEQAAAEAAAVAQSLGDRLVAFQIGNEPDLFGSKRNGLRPSTYTYYDFLAEWQTVARAVKRAVPTARFAGPDTAGSPAWVAQFGQDVPDAIFLSQHYYAEGPAGSPFVTTKRLLNSTTRLSSVLGSFQRAADDAGLPFRMTEMNSCYNGGQKGVSDTFASALWGITALFQILDAGAAGVNFHGGPGGAYTPIARVKKFEYEPRPLYYAPLFFAQIGSGHLVSARLTGARSVTAYAVAHDDGAVTLALVNASAVQPRQISIDPGGAFTRGTVLRLTAPSLDAKAEITFGGASVDSDGAWSAASTENIAMQGARFTLDLPPASAAYVKLLP